MNFSTAGHVEAEKTYVSNFMKPGIHVAKIQKVEFRQSQGGTPGVTITLEGKPMDELDGKGQTCDTTWWLSEKAWEYTKARLVILADKLGKRTELDAIKAADAQEYTQGLASVFTGCAGRFKLAGQEIEGKVGDDGVKKSNWFKAEMAAFGFVEPVSVSEADSKLTFDEDNKYDMKRLPKADLEVMSDDPLEVNGEGTEESPW
jgi:hypothetical protein